MKACDYVGRPPKIPLEIVYDNREKKPFTFDPQYAIAEEGYMKHFDYKLKGDDWAIERKSVGDLIQSFTTGRERELRKIEKARVAFDPDLPLIYLIEGTVSDIVDYPHWHRFKRIRPPYFLSQLFRLSIDYGFDLLFTTGRPEATMVLYRLLRNRQIKRKENDKDNSRTKLL